MNKQSYELSLWKDIVQDDGTIKEERIAIIGSDTSVDPLGAYDVTPIGRIDGVRQLEFSVKRKYRDEEGNLVDNPLIYELANESKVKLRRGPEYNFFDINGDFAANKLDDIDEDERWTDYIIKNVDENSNTYTNTYIAYEAYVNELGKNGWAVTLDTELENNFGTLPQLAERVLEGSGWIVGQSYAPTETKVENLGRVTLSTTLPARNVKTQTVVYIPAGSNIYVRYGNLKPNGSQWSINQNSELQFIYTGKDLQRDQADDAGVFQDEDLNYVYRPEGPVTSAADVVLMGTNGTPLIKGTFIIRKPISRYNKEVDRYVEEYLVNGRGAGKAGMSQGDVVYKYDKTDYITASIVESKTTNHRDFISTTSWTPMVDGGSQKRPTILSLPNYSEKSPSTSRVTNYMLLRRDGSARHYTNEGPKLNNMRVTDNQYYVVRYKARMIHRDAKDYPSKVSTSSQTGLSVQLGYYDAGTWKRVTDKVDIGLVNSQLNTDSSNYDTYGYPKGTGTASTRRRPGSTGQPYVDENGYAYVYLQANTTTNSILQKLELRFNVAATTGTNKFDYAIADIQLFEYIEDNNGTPIFVGDIPTGEAIVRPTYFRIGANGKEEVLPSNSSYYNPSFSDSYASVRHIEVKESNYFNILQQLAELFQVWVSFQVWHTKDGRIWINNLGQPHKEVRFSRYAPNNKENHAGFKYGVNLENIRRSLDSNSLATKVIVKDNNQEYAIDGSASIKRAKSNPHGENEIYDFNYYIQQGILDEIQVLNDLYGISSRDLAYYPKLRDLNDEYRAASKLLGSYKLEIAKAEASLEALDIYESAANDQMSSDRRMLSVIPADSNRRESYLESISISQGHIDGINEEKAYYRTTLNRYSNLLIRDKAIVDDVLERKKQLKQEFYAKYSKYLQEGTWVDETYVDDELYYLDAIAVANKSAFPQVSYNIDVVDLANIDGFEGYAAEVGQQTTIEDAEFFGWTFVDVPGVGKIKTPYKMKAIVSETRVNLDDPTDASIVIQNYTNNFEDLFQKLNAASNTLQFSQGEYLKANQILNEDGSLKIQTLEEAFRNNALTLANANNQSIIWDQNGIELTDNGNSSLITKIIAGGIFLSDNGGRSWSAGITGNGINTEMLTTGTINTEKINLLTGGDLRFRWDGEGITALDRNQDGGYSFDKFVRFNDLGIFGTTTGATLEAALDEATTQAERQQAIRDYANWSLTWNGFIIHNNEGGVKLDPSSGLTIINPNWLWTQERINDPNNYAIDSEDHEYYTEGEYIPLISLGRQYETLSDSPYYGLRMRNQLGEITLTTDYNGNIWGKNTLELGAGELVDVVVPLDRMDPSQGEMLESYYKYLRLDGNPDTTAPYIETPMIAVGDTNPSMAPFRVYGDGYVVMENTSLKGDFMAESLILTGDLKVGEVAGINGIANDSAEDGYVFWSGKTDAGHPSWYVTPSGAMYATEAYINGQGTFSGNIYADNGYFKGEIDASSGKITGRISFGENETSYVGIDESNYYLNIEDRFKVNTTGDIFADTLNLMKNPNWDTEFNTFSNLVIGKDNTPLQIFNPTTTRPQSDRVFAILDDGSIEMNGVLSSTNDIVLDGMLKLNNPTTGETGIVINGKTGSIESKTPAVDGWGIYDDGTAYFNDIYARGKISTAVFEQNRTSSIGGDLLVSPSVSLNRPIQGVKTTFNCEIAGLEVQIKDGGYTFTPPIKGKVKLSFKAQGDSAERENILIWADDGTGEDKYIAKVSDSMGLYTCVLDVVNDIKISTLGAPGVTFEFWGFEVEKVNTDTNSDYTFTFEEYDGFNDTWKYVDRLTLDVNNISIDNVPYDANTRSITLTAESLSTLGITDTLPPSTIMISTSSQTNSIMLSASQPRGAYIKIEGPRAGTDNSTVVIGNLQNSLIPADQRANYFGDDLGYGLYADNAYLTGRMYLPDAGITNEDILYQGSPVRMFAGAAPKNMDAAPFIVTQDGTMYATQANISGNIYAEDSIFSGYIVGAGVLLDNDTTEDPNDHFYFSRNWYTGDPTPESYVMDITEQSVDIWKGFNVYSDYYRIENHMIYGYHNITNPQPWSMINKMDSAAYSGYRPHMHTIGLNIWDAHTNSADIKSVQIVDGKIRYVSRNIREPFAQGQKAINDLLWSAENAAELGWVDHDDYSIFGVSTTEEFNFTDGENIALTIEPRTNTSGNRENMSRTTVRGVFNIDDTVEIRKKGNSVVFDYIGG